MKKLLLILLLLIPGVCSADFEITKWQYFKDLRVNGAGLQKFVIDDQMFASSERDMRDLRVLEKQGNEVPYKLIRSTARTELKTYYPRIINNSYEAGEDSSVVLDFGENNPGVNSLEIVTPTDNFQAYVKVLGSDTMDKWRTLKENIYIYDYSDPRAGFKSQKTSLNFPESLFRYLKLEIVDNGDRVVRISSVSARLKTVEKSKELERAPEFKLEQKDSNTEIIIDLETGGIPTNGLRINSGDKNFNRGVLVFSSYNGGDWRRIGSGNIFRYDTDRFRGENLKINFSETSDRFLKLVISNYDDPPVSIDAIRSYSVYREVIFLAEEGKEYRIYFGNPQARFPRYDLDTYFKYLDLDKAGVAELSTQKQNPAYRALEREIVIPQSEKIPFLMPLALIVSSLLLLFLVFKFFKEK